METAMKSQVLKGWKHIVYTIITNHFHGDVFTLEQLYQFEPHFAKVYPSNYHIKDKIRQILQQLRDLGLVSFSNQGSYQLVDVQPQTRVEPLTVEQVYLLMNESLPGWVKIGRTNSIQRRLKELYNTSVPLPFKIIDTITLSSENDSRTLEKTIHSIIDTLNPKLRKDTEAKRREFFQMTPEQGKSIFELVTKIVGIQPTTNADLTTYRGI